MILRPHQIYLLRMTGRAAALNFGGDSSSDSSTAVTNNTRNDAMSIDRRSVASDAAVSLTGDNNTVDRSTADNSVKSTYSMTSFLDQSMKDSGNSTTSSTSFADSSSKNSGNTTSTSFADSSAKNSGNTFIDNSQKNTSFTDNSSSANYTTLTDYGSIGQSLASLGAMTNKAFNTTGTAVNGAIGSLASVSYDNQKSVASAFEAAKEYSANALSSSADVLGFATSQIDKSTKAAQGPTNKLLIGCAVATVALIAYKKFS